MNLNKVLFIVLAMVISTMGLIANEISYDNGQLSFQTGNFEIVETTINGETFTTIKSDAGVDTNEAGFATLPFFNASVILNNRNVDVEINAGEYQEYQLAYPMLPSRGTIYRDVDPSTVPYITAPESIVNGFYPNSLATASEPYIIRDIRGTNIYLYPFQYNAETQTLRVYNSMNVNLVENNSAVINPLPNSDARLTKVMDNLYRTAFINYSTTRFDHEIEQFGSILVLRPAEYADAIAPYVQWKREKGHTVYEVEVSGNVTTTVEEQYAAHNDILYVQLVGDWDDISGPTSGGAATDPNLGCVVGTDIYPELIVGRFSAASATDVTTQVNKTLNYEKTPEAGDWLSKGLGIASEQGAGTGDDGEADYAHMDIIKENRLLPFTYTEVAEAYQFPSIGDISGPINDGLSLINYCGHGSKTSWVTSGFNNSNVNALTNGNKMPFIISIACVNGDFQSGGDCFAEAWMKKVDGGAVGMYAATINQSWAPPMKGQDYMMDLIIGGYDYSSNPGNGTSVDVQKTSYGAVCFNGSILMTLEDPSGGPSMLETWTIFGDASLQIRTAQPEVLTLSNSTVFSSMDYTTTITTNGNAVEGALVSLYQDGVAYTGTTDASGNVTIAHTMIPGTSTMTVTAFNAETIYNDACEVVPQDGPYMILESYAVNGNANYAENFGLDINFRNVGTISATNLVATLSSNDDYITISDATVNVGAIEPETTVSLTDIFDISVDNDVPNGHNAEFTVAIAGNEGNWEVTFAITLGAPEFEIGNMIIADSGNNGLLDAGETATITIPVTNVGVATSLAISTELVTSTSNLITIDSATFDMEALNAGETGIVTYDITVASDAAEGATAILALSLTSGQYFANSSFYPSVGLVFEDFESGDFSGMAWEQGSTGWEISTDAYEGTYSMKNETITDGSSSSISITIDVASDGEITFWQNVSSESNYDYLRFYINGTQSDEWSGTGSWSEETYSVTAGETTFKWEYEKDGSVSSGSDCGWIDMITFPGGGAMVEAPIFSLSNSEIDFENVALNETATETFTISNLGNAELTGDIETAENFEVDITTFAIAAGENVEITVSFTPTEAMPYSGTINITSNDTNASSATVEVTGTGGAMDNDNMVPVVTELMGNYPNPFNPTTTIRFALSTDENVSVEVYNVKGQLVKTLVNDNMQAGYHSVVWSGKDNSNKQASSGIYFYKFRAGSVVDMKKMIMLK